MEGDIYPDDYWLMAEVSGNPENYHPMNEYQESNLSWWDKEIERLGTEMKKDQEMIIEQRKKSDEYQQRTNSQLRDL